MLARLSREPDLGVRSALIEGLSRIPAPGTDDRLVQALRGSTHVPQGLLVEIVVARQAAGATPVLLDLAAGDDPELARDALRALGELGDPDTGRALVELMGPATPEGIARSSLVRIARRLEPPRVDWLLSDWDTRPPGVQAALMPVLSAVGGEDALTAVRGGLASESPEVRAAALRALGDWPDSAAAPDLLGVARSSANEEEVRRALAGWTRVLGAEGAGPSEASWREAFSLASRPEERKALLGALVRAPRPGLRDQVLGLRDDPELSEEATLALAAMARDPATDPPVQLELWRALYASDAADELRNEALEARVGAGDEARLTAPDGVSRRWRRDGESLALEEDGQVLWAFEFGPERTKPFFHPLAQPGTAPVTARSPADHPWHYGLWFSWKYVNGVNYWEEDRETGRAAGTTSWTPPRIALRHDGSARVELDLRYQPAGGHPVLREARTIEVSPPRGDGAYALDWSLTFTALTEVVLDRTPLPTEPDGQVWGGYAGLSARLSTELTERKTSLTAGEPRWVDDRIRLRAEAVDYSGVVEGRRLGLAILDHPLNLNAPTPWYAIQSEEMSFFSPAVICFGAHRLGAGESLTLRYRVWVHPGAWPGDRLRRAYREYTDE
jgi:HEAT repeat protein